MSLKAPFQGDLFEADFAEATKTVSGAITSRLPAFRGSAGFQAIVYQVMRYYLAGLQEGAFPLYSYNTPATNTGAISYITGATGYDKETTETVLSEVEIQAATGGIPYWFKDAQEITVNYNVTQDQAAALRPSFLARVATTILSPLGIPVESLISTLKTILVLAIVLVLVWIAVKVKGILK